MKAQGIATHHHGNEPQVRVVLHDDESRAATLGERVVAFLRARHPRKAADHVAAETGVPVNTIRTWLERSTAPRADHYVALVSAYGPEFLHATMAKPKPWLLKSVREEQAKQLKAEIAAREAKLRRLTQ